MTGAAGVTETAGATDAGVTGATEMLPRLLAVHAHADDETITMGGLLALASERGHDTAVVCCTDGELATIVDPSMPEEETRPKLAQIRREELREACRILGVTEVHFLGYHDSGMAGAESNLRPEAFWRVDMDEAVGRLVTIIRAFRPHVLATYDAYGGYGHPDHIQTHRVALLAVEAADNERMYRDHGTPWRVEKLYYSAFPRSQIVRATEMARAAGMDPPFGEAGPDEVPFGTADELVTTEIDCSTVLARKREALLAHRSQISAEFPLLAIPDEIQREHFASEFFTLALSRVPTALPEQDVFAGLEHPAHAEHAAGR